MSIVCTVLNRRDFCSFVIEVCEFTIHLVYCQSGVD